MIKAPYNFVPLAQKIVFPEWAPKISIDRPFEDGISGTINVRYTAQTPIFIGNGKDGNNAATKNYMSANGKFAIPGSSLRGMLRNVIEIASFGKFCRVSNATLSVRDLNNRNLYSSHLTKMRGRNAYEALSKGGWLDFDENDKAWVLYPVAYHRIEDSDIENFYHLRSGSLKDRQEFEKRIGCIKNKGIYFSTTGEEAHQHHAEMILYYSKVEKIKETSFPAAKHGYTVLTGQPGRKFSKKHDREMGKHLDFIFEDKGKGKIIVDYETILQFKQANVSKAADQKKGLDLTGKLKTCKHIGYPGIPVFYLPAPDGKPKSLGLSMMYRLPYTKTLHEAIENASKDNFAEKMDFAECIFGKISNTRDMSLKGRVQFEDAVAENAGRDKTVDTILGNPKPTYYPTYIEQAVRNSDYKTLMDDDVRLRGWKRYPVKDEPNPMQEGNGQGNVASHFVPLKKGTVFEGKIHFHNLKKEELGALLWTVTWGNDAKLSHAVGMGKPYGYGQIKAEISSLSYLPNDAADNVYKDSRADELSGWIKSFTAYMERTVTGWQESAQLRELKAMANPANAKRTNWDLSHMSLNDANKRNQFVDAKRKENNGFLAPYSEENQEKHLASGQNFGYNPHNDRGQRGGQKPRGQEGKITHSENGVANNSRQLCILLEEKTLKKGWKAAVKNARDICGPIVNTKEVPSDKQAGDEIELKVTVVKGANSSFMYEKGKS